MDEGDAGPTEICSHEECVYCHPGINCLVLFTLYGMNLQYFYPPQGKVMFSEASVCSGGGIMSLPVDGPMFFPGGLPTGRGDCLRGWGLPTAGGMGSACSSQYAFYWNAFFFQWLISLVTVRLLFGYCYAFSLECALLKILRLIRI